MLNAEQVEAIKFAIVAIRELDHDCKSYPRGEHGCQVCDRIQQLEEIIK